MAYNGDVSNYGDAMKFLGKRRSKNIANNTKVVRLKVDPFNNQGLPAEAAGLLFHSTVVVTWLPDGRQIIYTGGWNTVTTKDRINRWSSARVYSGPTEFGPRGGVKEWGLAVWYDDMPRTPSRVAKCRACAGTGKGAVWCTTASRWGHQYGSRPEHCEHGYKGLHIVALRSEVEHWCYSGWRDKPCKHGETTYHGTGEMRPVHCQKCDGKGTQDYGNQPKPFPWDGSPLLIDASGKPIEVTELTAQDLLDLTLSGFPYTYEVEPVPDTQPKLYIDEYEPPPSPFNNPHLVLSGLIPGVMQPTVCPACERVDVERVGDVASTVMHLNDEHKWSREDIADWLESLDVDLTIREEVTT